MIYIIGFAAIVFLLMTAGFWLPLVIALVSVAIAIIVGLLCLGLIAALAITLWNLTYEEWLIGGVIIMILIVSLGVMGVCFYLTSLWESYTKRVNESHPNKWYRLFIKIIGPFLPFAAGTAALIAALIAVHLADLT